MVLSIVIFAVLGFCISLYTYIAEYMVRTNPTFKPFCDLSDRISCTKPMKSRYAKIFYISNALVGMAFYAFMILLASMDAIKLLLIAASLSFLVSVMLAYILYVKIKALCLLCTALYIINITMLVLILRIPAVMQLLSNCTSFGA